MCLCTAADELAITNNTKTAGAMQAVRKTVALAEKSLSIVITI